MAITTTPLLWEDSKMTGERHDEKTPLALAEFCCLTIC